MKLSGLRATIVMNDGATLDAKKVEEAFDGGNVDFVSLEKKDILVPQASYVLAVTGTT